MAKLTHPDGIAFSVMLAFILTFVLVVPETIGAQDPHSGTRIDCKLAKALSLLPARPLWFPVPQPAHFTIHVNADAPPVFYGGLKWNAGESYFWLTRLPQGANLGDPGAERVTIVSFNNIGQLIDILRLRSKGQRLYAQWPTSGRYPDTTALVAKAQSPLQFTRFLRSLQPIRWPVSCP